MKKLRKLKTIKEFFMKTPMLSSHSFTQEKGHAHLNIQVPITLPPRLP